MIGGGAAGLMAAITAARQGAAVTLLEPNERLGKKVNITGKGRCNVTNDCDRETLLASIPGNGRFPMARCPWTGRPSSGGYLTGGAGNAACVRRPVQSIVFP